METLTIPPVTDASLTTPSPQELLTTSGLLLETLHITHKKRFLTVKYITYRVFVPGIQVASPPAFFSSPSPLSNTTIDWGAKAPKILNLPTMKGNGMVF